MQEKKNYAGKNIDFESRLEFTAAKRKAEKPAVQDKKPAPKVE
jgi:hypothetical protein